MPYSTFIGVVYKALKGEAKLMQWFRSDSVSCCVEGGRTLKFYYYRKQGIDNAISIHWLYGPCIKVSADEEMLCAMRSQNEDYTAVHPELLLSTSNCYKYLSRNKMPRQEYLISKRVEIDKRFNKPSM